jgi:hypothetical protein
LKIEKRFSSFDLRSRLISGFWPLILDCPYLVSTPPRAHHTTGLPVFEPGWNRLEPKPDVQPKRSLIDILKIALHLLVIRGVASASDWPDAGQGRGTER